MDKHFSVEPFEYGPEDEGEGEDERAQALDHRRDHRGDRRGPSQVVYRTPPVANTISTGTKWAVSNQWQSPSKTYYVYTKDHRDPASHHHRGNDARWQRWYPRAPYPYQYPY